MALINVEIVPEVGPVLLAARIGDERRSPGHATAHRHSNGSSSTAPRSRAPAGHGRTASARRARTTTRTTHADQWSPTNRSPHSSSCASMTQVHARDPWTRRESPQRRRRSDDPGGQKRPTRPRHEPRRCPAPATGSRSLAHPLADGYSVDEGNLTAPEYDHPPQMPTDRRRVSPDLRHSINVADTASTSRTQDQWHRHRINVIGQRPISLSLVQRTARSLMP